MPRLSPTTGRLLSGVGGSSGNIAINGTVVPSLASAAGGGWDWFDEDTIGGQADLGAGYAIRQVVVSTDTLSTLGSGGATSFAAGHGIGAAFLSPGGVRPIKGAAWTTQTLGALGSIDRSGVTALIQNFQAGRGLQPFAANGSALPVVDVAIFGGSDVLIREGLISAKDAQGVWHLYVATTGALAPFAARTDDTSIYRVVPVTIGGVLYVVETGGINTTIRPATSTMGFVLQTVAIEDEFGVDAIEVSSGVARVCWAVNAGETPTSCRCVDFTPQTGSGAQGTTASGSLVFGSASGSRPSTFSVGPVQGGGGSLALTLPQHEPVVTDAKMITTPWYGALLSMMRASGGPIDMSRLTGMLPPSQGGTGGTTGLSPLNGQNIIAGTIPCSAIQPDCLGATHRRLDTACGWV